MTSMTPYATALPLDTWRNLMGVSPWHFWGIADQTVVPVLSKCSTITYEYDWQGSDAAGRSTIRDAIMDAEDRLLDFLGYRVGPQYAEETVVYPRYYDDGQIRIGNWGSDARRPAIQLSEGRLQALGVEALTVLGTATTLNGSLYFSDAFGSGFDDTAHIVMATTLTDASGVCVFFDDPDRFDDPELSSRWEVRPIQCQISGGNLLITIRRWLLVRPVLYESPIANRPPIDPNNVTAFVQSLTVAERTTNSDGQTFADSAGVMLWETSPCGAYGWCCPCSGNLTFSPTDASRDPAATGFALARVGIRQAPYGIVTAGDAVYDASSGQWVETGFAAGYEPDRIRVRYRAGEQADRGSISPIWAGIVAKLATAELKRRICACEEQNEKLQSLQQDMTLESTQTQRFAPAPEDLSNPFGTRRGHIQVWRAVKERVLIRGLSL